MAIKITPAPSDSKLAEAFLLFEKGWSQQARTVERRVARLLVHCIPRGADICKGSPKGRIPSASTSISSAEQLAANPSAKDARTVGSKAMVRLR